MILSYYNFMGTREQRLKQLRRDIYDSAMSGLPLQYADSENIADLNLCKRNFLFRCHLHPDPYAIIKDYEHRVAPPEYSVFATPHLSSAISYIKNYWASVRFQNLFYPELIHGLAFLTIFEAKQDQNYYGEYPSFDDRSTKLPRWEAPNYDEHLETFIDVKCNPIHARYLIVQDEHFFAPLTRCVEASMNEFRVFSKWELVGEAALDISRFPTSGISATAMRPVLRAFREMELTP